MERYVAFLRGINLGNRRIKNEELRRHFEEMGMEEVATFRASGNVVFAVPGRQGEAKLQARVEAELERRLGYDVAVFLRSLDEVAAIAALDPFDAGARKPSKGKLQVLLLARKPTVRAREAALAQASEEDPMEIVGREFLWQPRGGLAETVVDLGLLGDALGKGTMRTMGTIRQIAARHCAG